MAIKLIQKEQDYYKKGNFENLQAGLYKKYLKGIKNCLFNQFEELGTYCGAWTSGRITKTKLTA
jgi:vacuolar-type H+-ATPase subunit C/Vma6